MNESVYQEKVVAEGHGWSNHIFHLFLAMTSLGHVDMAL